MTPKKLGLDHLLEGMKLAQQVEQGDVSAMSKMLAVYLADAETLWKAKSNPEILEVLEKQALALDYEEAAEMLSFFMQALQLFAKKLQSNVRLDVKKK